MMNKVLLILSVVFSLPYHLCAYDGEVHHSLNNNAVIDSGLNLFLQDQLGMAEGVDTKLKEKIFNGTIVDNALDWLAYGGEAEDFGMRLTPIKETTTRAFNHFHDPLRDWDDAGLDAIINLVYTGNYGRSPVSLILWGLDPGRQAFHQNKTGDWSWDKAREYYFAFLTGRVFSGNEIASTDAERKSSLADCLRAVGQMMHLVQDASVPLHTRNDVHLLSGTYETYADSHIATLLQNLTTVRPGPEWLADPQPESTYSVLPPVTGLIDRNQYNGRAIPPNNETIGLAEYSNANFLTEDTMWQYPHPSLDETSYDSTLWLNPEAVDAEDGVTDHRIYFQKEAGEPVDHLMAAAYWYFQLYRMQSPDLIYAFILDEKCYADYAAKLIPRAVGYSAELLDYFFRGRLRVTSKAIIQDNHLCALELGIGNMTTSQDQISDGTFFVTVRYTPTGGNPDGSDDIFISTNDVASGVLPYGQTSTYRFDLSEPVPLENYKSAKCMLAYRGNLGTETTAVIGKYFMPEAVDLCLLIEMDNEYLLWDLQKGGLMTLTDSEGEIVTYPLSYSQKDYFLKSHGLQYKSGLNAGLAINPPSTIFQTASTVSDCECYYLNMRDCLIQEECGATGGDADICDEYGENQFGYTRITRALENVWDDYGYDCLGFRISQDETWDYSGNVDIEIPGTDETFSYKKAFYHHDQWARISHQWAPLSSGYDSYKGPEDRRETGQAATLTSAGLDPTAPDMKRKFAFFWHQWRHEEHKEWEIPAWDKTRQTVNDSFLYYNYYYRSQITPSLTQEGAPVLSYSIESHIGDSETSAAGRHNMTYYPVASGFIDRFAIVLEQPIITYEQPSGDASWEVVRYWTASKLYIQDNAQPKDPENPASGYSYDWDQLSAVDMDRIFSRFSKTLAEDIAERGAGAGLKISIYAGI